MMTAEAVLEPCVIPAELVRRVHETLNRNFDRQLEEMKSGGITVDGKTPPLQLACLLRRQHELEPFRAAMIDALQSRQDPVTGLVRTGKDSAWPKALADVTSMLRALGATLRHPVHPLMEITEARAFRQWMTRCNWGHPWGGADGAGHMVIGALFSLSDLGLLRQSTLNAAFDHLDELRDDKYGVWTKGRFDDSNPGLAQLGGAFAFGMLYARFARPLPRAEGACLLMMDLQARGGMGTFCFNGRTPWPHGSIDMDAIYVLVRYARINEELRRQVQPAISRYIAYFRRKMETDFTVEYPVPKLLALLRPHFAEPADDVPHYDYQMFHWSL
jgi:hypothetical protein